MKNLTALSENFIQGKLSLNGNGKNVKILNPFSVEQYKDKENTNGLKLMKRNSSHDSSSSKVSETSSLFNPIKLVVKNRSNMGSS
jgi:hypothetical protein